MRRALGRRRVLSGERDPVADVAQLVEQLPCKQQVTSSSLVIGSRLPWPARRVATLLLGDQWRDTEAVKRGRL